MAGQHSTNKHSDSHLCGGFVGPISITRSAARTGTSGSRNFCKRKSDGDVASEPTRAQLQRTSAKLLQYNNTHHHQQQQQPQYRQQRQQRQRQKKEQHPQNADDNKSDDGHGDSDGGGRCKAVQETDAHLLMPAAATTETTTSPATVNDAENVTVENATKAESASATDDKGECPTAKSKSCAEQRLAHVTQDLLVRLLSLAAQLLMKVRI